MAEKVKLADYVASLDENTNHKVDDVNAAVLALGGGDPDMMLQEGLTIKLPTTAELADRIFKRKFTNLTPNEKGEYPESYLILCDTILPGGTDTSICELFPKGLIRQFKPMSQNPMTGDAVIGRAEPQWEDSGSNTVIAEISDALRAAGGNLGEWIARVGGSVFKIDREEDRLAQGFKNGQASAKYDDVRSVKKRYCSGTAQVAAAPTAKANKKGK